MASIRHPAPGPGLASHWSGSWPLIGQGPGLSLVRTVTPSLGCQGGGGLIKLCDNVANFTVYCNIGGRGSPGKHGWRPSSIVMAPWLGEMEICFQRLSLSETSPLLSGLRVLLSWARAGGASLHFLHIVSTLICS